MKIYNTRLFFAFFVLFSTINMTKLSAQSNKPKVTAVSAQKHKPAATTKAKTSTPPPSVTLNQKGDITLAGKPVSLENLRKELQAKLMHYTVIPDKIALKTIGQTGMGMRAEVNTEINAAIAGAKWLRKKATLKSYNNTNKTETVQFAKGKTDTYVTRSINASSSIDLNLPAKKGQTIVFTIGYDFKDSDIEAFLTEPTLQDISLRTGPKSTNDFRVTKTGNHRLTIHNTSKKKITMTLYVNIE